MNEERTIRSVKGHKVTISASTTKVRGHTYPVDRVRWKTVEGVWTGTSIMRYDDQPNRAEEFARQIAKELDAKKESSIKPSERREFQAAQDLLKAFGEKIPVDVAVSRYIAMTKKRHAAELAKMKKAVDASK